MAAGDQMGILFGRRVVLQMGAIEVDGLRISFKVEKDNKPEPNKAEISVWNLSRETRANIVASESVPIAIQVGYGEDIEQIFIGDIMRDGITTTRDGGDWVTTFKAGDGADAYRSARIQESFAKGAKIEKVLKKLSESLGVGMGNALDKIKQGDIKGGLTEFFGGTVLSGQSSVELTRMLDSLDMEWSIQDGQLQIVEKGLWNDEAVVVLTPETGLIGSPEPGNRKKDKPAITKFRSLLQPGIKPLRRVQVKSESVDGIFVVSKVLHTGDIAGQDWYSDCEGLAIS